MSPFLTVGVQSTCLRKYNNNVTLTLILFTDNVREKLISCKNFILEHQLN